MDLRYSSFVAAVFLFTLSLCGARAAYAEQAGDPCALLTPQQVGHVLGTSIEAAKRVAPRLCEWTAANQPNSLNAKKVAITISNERAFGYAKTPIATTVKAAPVAGICDDAAYSMPATHATGLDTSLYVKKATSYFVVHVYGFPDQTKAMALEKTLAIQACSKL